MLMKKLKMDEYRAEKYKTMEIDKANLSDVEAAYSSSTIINKILWDKKFKNDKQESYDEKF